VNSTSSKPYSWIRKIPRITAQLDAIPLLGNAPEVPWNELAKELANLLEIEQLTITPSEFALFNSDELSKEIGTPLSLMKFSLLPLSGELYFALPENQLAQLARQLLMKDLETVPIDRDIQTAFFQFLALETIHILNQLGYPPAIAPSIAADAELPECPMLGLDIAITAGNLNVSSRVFISPELEKSLRTQFVKEQSEAVFKRPQSEQMDVILHLEGGSTTLSLDEWKTVKPGDFLVIDRCSLTPGKDSGTVTLTLNGIPVLRGTIQDGSLQILENPLFREDR
jgi:flagellar motor switch protein FliN